MPATAHGWPYPDGTVKIADLGTKIQDVAIQLERRLQGGTVTFPSASGTVDIAVVFPVAFTNVPALMHGHNGTIVTNALHNSLGLTGFTYRLVRSSAGAIDAQWFAFDYTS